MPLNLPAASHPISEDRHVPVRRLEKICQNKAYFLKNHFIISSLTHIYSKVRANHTLLKKFYIKKMKFQKKVFCIK